MTLHEGSTTDELRALRARAYGPHADIAEDPAALRRLHELEERARPGTSDAMASPSERDGEQAGIPHGAGESPRASAPEGPAAPPAPILDGTMAGLLLPPEQAAHRGGGRRDGGCCGSRASRSPAWHPRP